MPSGLLAFFQATYAFACAKTPILGQLLAFCVISSGAMQGDLASGSLWAFSMDPLLRALRKRLALSPGSEA
eukprot:7441135-Pyramimonas_sp.AAC.1